jgi:hypothetical protein
MIGQYYMQLVLDSKPKETGSYSCVAVNPTLGLEVRSIVVQVTVTFPSVTLIEDGLVTNGLISVVKILISEPFCTFPI